MEFAQREMQVVSDTIDELASQALSELTEAQLALIGGGCGEIVPY